MEEEAPPRRSVAELAGRFKAPAPSNDAAANQTDKPVRRRPPRSLNIPKPQAEEKEPAGVTSPAPKAKRNSALIEKLQANLALSPTAMLPSPKSPGFKLVPPNFSPLSPGSGPATVSSSATPTSPLTASPVTEEEGPVSFEDPLSVSEGSILSNINKGRVRHSLRRRPPSRRHRKSSSGDDVGVVSDVPDSATTSLNEPQDKQKTTGGEDGEVEGEVFKKDKTDDVEEKTDSTTCPEKEENKSKSEPKVEEEKTEEENKSKGEEEKTEEENKSKGEEEKTEEEIVTTVEEEKREEKASTVEEDDVSSSEPQEEQKSGEQNEVSTDEATNTEKEEEETKETTS